MGLFDSKSKSSSSSQQSGAQTQLGNPISVVVGGKKNQSHLTVNTVQSDHGAIEGAFKFADQVSARNAQLAQRELDSAERVSKYLLTTSGGLAGNLIDQAKSQGETFTETVGELVQGFQDFTNSENNPGERVNLYLIMAATGLAAVFFLKAN